MSYAILAQGFKMQNLVEEYKAIFPGKPDRLWNSLKSFYVSLSFL